MNCKKLLALLLALCLIAFIAACSDTGGNSGTSGGASESTADGGNASPESKDTGDADNSGEPVTLSIFIDHSWYPIESFTGIIPEEITRQTGIILDPTIAVDQNQIGVMMSSGELPDLVYTQNMIDRMSNADISYSYEELLETYDTGWKPTDTQIGIGRSMSADGIAYTIANHVSYKEDWEGSSSVPMVGSMLYRVDLWEAIGSPQVTNFQEMYDSFVKMKEQFPDIVPLKLNENWNTLVFRYLNGIGGVDFVEQADGGYIHYIKDERYKENLMWLNECMRAGFIVADDSYFVAGSTAIADDQYFMSAACTQNSIPGTNATLAAINPDYYLAELVPFAESSYLTSDTGWSATFITRQNKDPEASIKLMAWMFSEEGQKVTQMGREGTEYTLNDSGLPVFSDEWVEAITDGTQNTKYNPWFYLGGSELVEADARCATTDPALVADTYEIIRDRFDNYPWIMGAYPHAEKNEDEKVIFDKIKELVKTYEAKVIMAGSAEEAESVYEEFMSNAKTTGLDQLEEFMTASIAESKKLYE